MLNGYTDPTIASLDPTRPASRFPRGEESKAQAAADRAARFAPRETATMPEPQNAGALAYQTGIPLSIAQRILALEAQMPVMQSIINGLYARLAVLEQKS